MITGNSIIKDFLFVFDPPSLLALQDRFSREAVPALMHLRESSGITTQLVLPRYIFDISALKDSKLMKLLKVITEGPPPIFNFDKVVAKRLRKDCGELLESKRELALLSLSESMVADGIVTGSKLLIQSQYVLYQYHRIRVIPVDEFLDLISVIAVGNSVFWSTAYAGDIGFDAFYQMTHWKASRLFKWWARSISGREKKESVENLRAALLNRFPYILYSRDMVRFYQLHRDYYIRNNQRQMYGTAIGFYINTFYLMLWGMLDHLTIIAKHARDMRISERYCGIRSKDFWKEFRKIENGLYNYIKGKDISDWINIMADMRHQAAHSIIPIPSLLVNETTDSKKSDDEIIEILKNEKSSLYRIFDSQTIEALQPSWIADWKWKKMEIVAPGMIRITKPDGTGYMRDPVVSVDHDLSNLIAVMDAFLVKLFN